MANSELLRYIQDQLKAGVGKEAIKKTLLDVGWLLVDVDEAFQAAGSAVVSSPAVTPRSSSPSQSPASFSQKSPAMALPVEKPQEGKINVSQGVSPIHEEKPKVTQFPLQGGFDKMSPVARKPIGGFAEQKPQPNGPVVFGTEKKDQPFSAVSPAWRSPVVEKPAEKQAEKPAEMPRFISSNLSPADPLGMAKNVSEPMPVSPALDEHGKEKLWLTLSIVAGVLALALLGWLVYDYVALGKKVGVLEAEKETFDARIVSLEASLEEALLKKTELEQSVTMLGFQNGELITELSFLVKIPLLIAEQGGASRRTATIRGNVEAGSSGSYFFRTAHDVRVAIANAKDEQVRTAVAPLVGQGADFTGSYVVGSRDFTVTAINGTLLPGAVPQETSPAQ